MRGEKESHLKFIRDLTDAGLFHPPLPSDWASFEKYRHNMLFGDLSFTSFYIWTRTMHYRIRITSGGILVIGLDTNRDIVIYVLAQGDIRPIDIELAGLYRIFRENGIAMRIECVSESELQYFSGLSFNTEVSYDDRFSDYIYDNSEFIALDGRRNKTKRHEYSRFVKHHPYAALVSGSLHDQKVRSDCENIFDRWCQTHRCKDCVFGCEKEAFARMCDIFDNSRNLLGIVYDGDCPISFGIGELLTDDCVFFHIQKNAAPIEGLTYYLHREMALRMHPNPKYINWGEDMGLEGIRRNKSRYAPVELRRKYTLLIR